MNKYQTNLKLAKEIMPLVVAASIDGGETGYLMVDNEVAEILVKKDWAESNDTISKDGKIATRSTAIGNVEFPAPERVEDEEKKEDVEKKQEPASDKPVTSVFVIEDVPIVKKRASSSNPKYPFDQLEIGQSFVIPVTEKRPEPWKSLSGTISVANSKYAEPVFEDDGETPVMRKKRGSETEQVQVMKLTRKFSIMKDTVDGKDVARMGRVALPV